MKVIILDMDGLMVDTERFYYAADHLVAKEYGKKIEESVISSMIGQKPLDSMRIFQKFLETSDSPEILLEKRDRIFFDMLQEEIKPMPGLIDFLTTFHQKVPIAVATGSPRKFVDIIIDKLSLKEYFSYIQTSDNIKKGKPDPEIYLKVLQIFNIPSSECIVIEDSSNGARAGKAAGCYVIAIPSIYTKNQDFSFVDHRAESLEKVKYHILDIL